MNKLRDPDILNFLLEILSKQENLLNAVSTDPEDDTVAHCKLLRKKLKEMDIQKLYRVLFLGGFASGKSALIDALLGDKLLKAEPVPSASVPTELHYADTPKIIMYPSKDTLKEGESAAPFEIKSELKEFTHYCRIGYEEQWDEWQPKFDKILFYCSVPFLKDKILVDTPGLRTQYTEEWIINECKKTDAIIYVMSSTMPLTATDRSILELICSIDYSSVIFAITMYDMIPDNARSRFSKLISSHCQKYTGLGKGSVHFVSSLEALEAKRTGNDEKFVDSGVDALEKQLHAILNRPDTVHAKPLHEETNEKPAAVKAYNYILNLQEDTSDVFDIILSITNEMLDISQSIRSNNKDRFAYELEIIDAEIRTLQNKSRLTPGS